MDLEEKGKLEEAGRIFLQAWNEATNDFEKFIAAHYVAQHQKKCFSDKLKWFETTLQLALKINNDSVKGAFASLYLRRPNGGHILSGLIFFHCGSFYYSS